MLQNHSKINKYPKTVQIPAILRQMPTTHTTHTFFSPVTLWPSYHRLVGPKVVVCVYQNHARPREPSSVRVIA